MATVFTVPYKFVCSHFPVLTTEYRMYTCMLVVHNLYIGCNVCVLNSCEIVKIILWDNSTCVNHNVEIVLGCNHSLLITGRKLWDGLLNL